MHTRVYAKMRMPLSLIFQEYILNRQVWIWKIIDNYIFFYIVYVFYNRIATDGPVLLPMSVAKVYKKV